MPRRSPTPETPPPARGTRVDAYDFLQDEREDRRPLQTAIAFAVAAHIALLIVNFPNWQGRAETPEPPKRKVFVMETKKYAPPPPPTETPPPTPKTRPVPMPDPTPDEPEPLVVDVPTPDIQPQVDTIFLDGLEPPAPPEPEPTGPLIVGGDVKPPTRKHYVEPRYTEMARRARLQGSVIVQLVVDERGHVTEITPLKGLGLGLTEEVVRAVKQWRFEPGTLNGKPVAVLYTLTVHMRLS